ncbi:MAG: arylesterase [Gemmatimonadota bacterium]|jgi:acyl-CoA thioesterase-1
MNRRLVSLLCVGALACSPSGSPPSTAETDAPASAAPVQEPSRPDAPADEPVVVFLGTSLTAGLGLLRSEDTYVSILAEMADSAGLPMDAVNAGVSGDTSAGGLRRLDWVLREPVDILVVELGANDGLRGQDPDATEQNLLTIVEKARSRYPGIRVVIAGMEAPPNLGSAYTRRFHDIFPDVARQTGAALVPFLLEDVAGIPALNQADGIHPNPEGERIVAHNVWPVLEPLLRAWKVEHAAASGGGS